MRMKEEDLSFWTRFVRHAAVGHSYAFPSCHGMLVQNHTCKNTFGTLQEDTATIRASTERAPGSLQVRNGQWAAGDFAQPGALMAGRCDAISSTYLVCINLEIYVQCDREPTPEQFSTLSIYEL